MPLEHFHTAGVAERCSLKGVLLEHLHTADAAEGQRCSLKGSVVAKKVLQPVGALELLMGRLDTEDAGGTLHLGHGSPFSVLMDLQHAGACRQPCM